MQDVFSDFFGWMEALPPVWAYLALLLIAYGENVVPPIPGDLVVVFGGYLAGTGNLNLFVVVLLATLGGALGFMSMYVIGYRIGDAVFAPDRLRWIPKERMERVRRWLQRWGYGVVAANRFLSGTRSVISLTVGMAHMDAAKTAFYATVSAILWTALIAYGGYELGDNWPVVYSYLRTYGQVVLTVLGLIALVLLAQWFMRRRRKEG